VKKYPQQVIFKQLSKLRFTFTHLLRILFYRHLLTDSLQRYRYIHILLFSKRMYS